MKAVRIERFGGPEVIRIEEVSIPQPAAGEVLVKVAAAGIDPVDYKIREGKYPAVKEDALPLTLGREIAGTVESVGAGVTTVSKGDRVFAMIGADGGYAEYARVKAEYLDRVPEHIDLVTAATIPLAAHTAWQALFDHGNLQPGQKVLIHGGSGGVGHFAVQFAKVKGATVYATGSEKSLDFIRELGADRAIDYKAERFEDICSDLDLVIDLIGGETQRRSWAVLREGGTLVSTLEEPKQDVPQAQGKKGLRFTAQPSGAQLMEIAALITAGRVKVKVFRTFPLSEAANAQRFLEEEHVEGKLALTVNG
jgi:NADPH:quinone reductase-like Zn-dependent oxidoreductase